MPYSYSTTDRKENSKLRKPDTQPHGLRSRHLTDYFVKLHVGSKDVWYVHSSSTSLSFFGLEKCNLKLPLLIGNPICNP